MFETKKSATKKMLKDISAAYSGTTMIAKKRKLLENVEELAIELRDQSLYEFWNEQSQLVNAEEAKMQGREYIPPQGKVFIP